MTIDLFDDLGERLDAIAGDHTDHLELRHPAELPLTDTADAASNRTVWLLAAAALLAVAAVWLGLRDGADLETEEPAVDPDAVETTPGLGTTLVTYDELPAVFQLDPLPADHPAVIAKDGWWRPSSIRVVEFDGGAVYVGTSVGNADVICLDVQLDGEETLRNRMGGRCMTLTGFLIGAPIGIAPDTATPHVAGLVPLGASEVTIDNGDLQVADGVYFALLDRPGVNVQPIDAPERSETRGTISGLLNGAPFDDRVIEAACYQIGDDWVIAGGGTDYGFSFRRLDASVGAYGSATEAAFFQRFTVSQEPTSADTLRLTVDFDQADTEGLATFDCSHTIDAGDFFRRVEPTN